MDIQEDYVSFETAKLLNNKSFNVPCRSYYSKGGVLRCGITYCNSELGPINATSAPTLQMTMKWLREVHNIHIELNPICTGDSDDDLEWHYGWAVKTTIFTDRWKRHNAEKVKYEKACETAIKYCLENLIK